MSASDFSVGESDSGISTVESSFEFSSDDFNNNSRIRGDVDAKNDETYSMKKFVFLFIGATSLVIVFVVLMVSYVGIRSRKNDMNSVHSEIAFPIELTEKPSTVIYFDEETQVMNIFGEESETFVYEISYNVYCCPESLPKRQNNDDRGYDGEFSFGDNRRSAMFGKNCVLITPENTEQITWSGTSVGDAERTFEAAGLNAMNTIDAPDAYRNYDVCKLTDVVSDLNSLTGMDTVWAFVLKIVDVRENPDATMIWKCHGHCEPSTFEEFMEQNYFSSVEEKTLREIHEHFSTEHCISRQTNTDLKNVKTLKRAAEIYGPEVDRFCTDFKIDVTDSIQANARKQLGIGESLGYLCAKKEIGCGFTF